MEDDFEEYLSRPAKRRRISHQGEGSVLSSLFPDAERLEKGGYGPKSRSSSPLDSVLHAAEGVSSQTEENVDEDEEIAIVDTSDNEEILLEDSYYDLDEDGPTSSLPASSPSYYGRLSVNSPSDQTETSASPSNVRLPIPLINNKARERPREHSILSITAADEALSNELQTASSSGVHPDKDSSEKTTNSSTPTQQTGTPAKSCRSGGQVSLSQDGGSDNEINDGANGSTFHLLRLASSQSSPQRAHASQTRQSERQSQDSFRLPSTDHASQNIPNSPRPLTPVEHPVNPLRTSPTRSPLLHNASQSSSSSTSLSPPPPFPPRRRTRESNRAFAPYTAYRRQYGDAAIAELHRIEQLEAGRRVFGQRSTAVDDDEDQTWVASQSQVEAESQNQTQSSIAPSFGSRTDEPIAKPRVVPKSIPRSRPDVPVPVWEARRPDTALILHQNRIPSRLHDPKAPRRFLDLDGSPVRPGGSASTGPSRISGGSTYKSSSKPVEPTHRVTPITANDALKELYGDESGDEGQDVEMGDDQVNDFNDFELFEDLAEPNADVVPVTDPDTGGSDMDAEPAQGEREESEKEDDSGRESSHSSNMDDEDKQDRKRQRILARVLPAVMIKKSAQQEREKELQRQRKRRDMERARREAEGLGDSDPDEPSGAAIRPGQSKTLRVPRERSTWNVSNEESDEVIDLTSDRESLDNDDVVVAENLPDELSSDDDDIGWIGRHDSADPMDFEAMEDNTFIDGFRSRSSNPSGRLVPRRRGPINRKDPYNNLRQSRIDRMLNSTSGTRRKSKHSKRSKTHHGSSSRGQGGAKASSRVMKNRPLNAYIIPAHPHVHIQTRLPFEPIQQAHLVSHQSRGKSDKRSSDKNNSSRGKSVTSALNGFAELFDVLASRNPRPKTKLSTTSRPTAFNPPSSKDTSFKVKSRPTESTASRGSTAYANILPYGDLADPDAKIEISLNSALAFGMRRHRQGFSFEPSSWLAQGKLLDLVRVLCGTSEPARPLPCHVSTIRFDATTSIGDLQLQFPTVCDLIFASVEKPLSDEDNTNVQQLMRFMCLFVSWSVIENEEDAKGMLEYVATQILALMDRVDEYLLINGRSGKEFDNTLLSIHWFAVEISNRIAKATASIKQTKDDGVIILNDRATDRYTTTLMARLLEFGIRRAMTAFQISTTESRRVERYALELWIALVHVTILQPTTFEESKVASSTFWRLVESSLNQCGRQFASAVHETEFTFATIFSLCSLSSVDALGTGQESRILHGYWPIVCRALSNIELSPETDKSKRMSQSTLAAKDTYIGMLFARCNVLAFRWDWSLQDPQEVRPLFELLRAALKDRKFMNLLHEQSDFPYFITQRNLRQLHEFDAKDSIQTIVIKLMLKKVEDAKEDMKSAKKWISLLASTSALEFTRENPPTQKELSTLFNQFTIKFVLLYVNPDVNNARAVINSSKKIVNFQNADHRSRLVCIRSAMIFGRFCRHFRLPLDEVVHWMSEMGVLLLDEHKILGVKATTYQKRETSTLCALLLGSLRDVLQTDLLDDVDNHQDLATPLYLENSIGMLGYIAKLLPLTRDWDASLAEETALLLMTIFRSRDAVFPPPNLPAFPRTLVPEDESQEDYGFDPIDVEAFTEVMKTHEEDANRGGFWVADSKLAMAVAELTAPVAALIGRLGYAEPAERKKANVELWMQCWAKIGAITHAHDLKSWDYFLQRGPGALGRVADLGWLQQTEPLFLLEVLRSDMRVYVSSKERFIRGWFLTLGADPDHVLPLYTYVLFRIDGFKHFLFENVPFRRDAAEDDYDETAYTDSRLNIVETVFSNLNRSYQRQLEGTGDSEVVMRNVEALTAISETLTLMRHNISDAPEDVDEAFRDYAGFCQDVVASLRTLAIGEHPKLSSLLVEPWVGKLERYLNPE